jgi:hypothetical protein
VDRAELGERAAGHPQLTWNIYGGPLPPGVVRRGGAAVSVPPGRLMADQRACLHDCVDRAFPPLLADLVKVTPQTRDHSRTT